MKYPVKTPLIFFGNNQLQLAGLNLGIAESAAQGKVAGVVVAKSNKLTLFKMLWQLMRGNIEKARMFTALPPIRSRFIRRGKS